MRVLAAADVFVTHHGLNSTHESIAERVPMLSYPFQWDQPGMAERCQALESGDPRSRASLAHRSTATMYARRSRAFGRSARGWRPGSRPTADGRTMCGSRRGAVVRRIAELADDEGAM